MVKHIVLFKLKEKTAENVEAAVSTLRGLDRKIESLRFIEVGVTPHAKNCSLIWITITFCLGAI